MKLLTCWPDGGSGRHCRGHMERCHRTKMNKAQIRELTALKPVYPGVECLYGNFLYRNHKVRC